MTVGWKLDPDDRAALLARFPPRYAETIADHVTLRFGTDDATPLPSATGGEIVGKADDDAGVQALVVRIDGNTERGDGSHYHITWSLTEGREAKESNQIISRLGWQALGEVIPVRLTPARWKT